MFGIGGMIIAMLAYRMKEKVEPIEEEKAPTDWALLISIITSALLVAALVIVIVVKYLFKTKKN